uniref:Uncharacterized protein n=1 Tax=Globodera rostochiensis TaxID=31243 RepID=A0A914GVQ6_GLORO
MVRKKQDFSEQQRGGDYSSNYVAEIDTNIQSTKRVSKKGHNFGVKGKPKKISFTLQLMPQAIEERPGLTKEGGKSKSQSKLRFNHESRRVKARVKASQASQELKQSKFNSSQESGQSQRVRASVKASQESNRGRIKSQSKLRFNHESSQEWGQESSQESRQVKKSEQEKASQKSRQVTRQKSQGKSKIQRKSRVMASQDSKKLRVKATEKI